VDKKGILTTERIALMAPKEWRGLLGLTKDNPGVTGKDFTHEVWHNMIHLEKNLYAVWERYRKESDRFAAPLKNRKERAENIALACMEEIGEICGHVKKHRFQGHDFDPLYILKELGDLCWYIARSARGLDAGIFDKIEPENISVSNLRQAMFHAADGLYSKVLRHVLCFGARLGFTFEDILGANLIKLHHRYPTGGFRVSDSVERGDRD
jgi:NTP pyrophosphatase (non-canonical NTP hydrolase)